MQILNSTQVPNEVLEVVIQGQLTERESRVLLFICRKTIGWQKLTEWLSLSHIEKGTGIFASHISVAISSLIQKGLIIREKRDGNHYYSLKMLLPKRSGGVTERVIDGLPIRQPIKDTLTKDILAVSNRDGQGYSYEPDEDTVPLQAFNKKQAKEGGYKGPETRKMLEWGLEQLEKGKKFTNPAVQMKAIKAMFGAGFTEEDIKDQWDWMATQKYWKDGFDFTNVAKNIHKSRIK